MATINNSDLTKELTEGAKIQTAYDNIPNQLAEKVVPVMEVNPKLLRRANFCRWATKTTTGTANILVLPSDKDFFCTGAAMNVVKDVACDMATGRLNVGATVDGFAVSLCSLPILTLTAQQMATSIPFTPPIKLDRGQTITWTSTWAAGNLCASVNLYGYVVDNVTA